MGRRSNIELLRIVSIFSIIIFHSVYKGNFSYDTYGVNEFILKILYFAGEFGTNIFGLITGYFMLYSDMSKIKAIKMIIAVEFYNLLSIILMMSISNSGFQFNVRYLFPILRCHYWYITAYIITYILSPYINKFIRILSEKEYKSFLITCVIIWSIIPTLFGVFSNTSEELLYFNRFIWILILYFMGAYLRIYGFNIFIKVKLKSLGVIAGVIMISSVFIIHLGKELFGKIGLTEPAYFWHPNTVCMLLVSVMVFEIFCKMDIKTNSIINKVASTTLGIYMLHDGYLDEYLWTKLFQVSSYQESPFLFFYLILISMLVLFIGFLTESVRVSLEKVIERLFSWGGKR